MGQYCAQTEAEESSGYPSQDLSQMDKLITSWSLTFPGLENGMSSPMISPLCPDDLTFVSQAQHEGTGDQIKAVDRRARQLPSHTGEQPDRLTGSLLAHQSIWLGLWRGLLTCSAWSWVPLGMHTSTCTPRWR